MRPLLASSILSVGQGPGRAKELVAQFGCDAEEKLKVPAPQRYRLIPLGQTDGQRAIAELEDAVLDVSERAMTATIEDLGSAALMVDLASMSHETQYTRMFRAPPPPPPQAAGRPSCVSWFVPPQEPATPPPESYLSDAAKADFGPFLRRFRYSSDSSGNPRLVESTRSLHY
jgi:hypothetical protein